MPETKDRARLKDRGGCFKLDQHDHGGCYRNRRRRMHHDAKLAVMGIVLDRMDMRHLGHSKQRQQDKTHHGDHRPSAWLGAASSAEICLKSSQQNSPHIKNTHNWMLGSCTGLLNQPEIQQSGMANAP